MADLRSGIRHCLEVTFEEVHLPEGPSCFCVEDLDAVKRFDLRVDNQAGSSLPYRTVQRFVDGVNELTVTFQILKPGSAHEVCYGLDSQSFPAVEAPFRSFVIRVHPNQKRDACRA